VEIEGNGAGDVAMLTDAYLFIFDGANTYRFPRSAGFPGEATGLAWDGTTLVISGSEGLVELPPANFSLGLQVN
jgi:hypothetical protein